MGILHTFDGEIIPPSHFLDFEVLNDHKIGGVAEIKAFGRVEGMIRREGLRRIQRIVRRIPTGRIEDIVVVLALLVETRISSTVVMEKSSGRRRMKTIRMESLS